MKICYVTSFLDLGRDKWSHFQRTVDKYFQEFQPLLTMFVEHPDAPNYDFVIFMDKAHLNKLPRLLPPHIHVEPIDEEYMAAHCPLWQRLDREQAIMQSQAYQNLIRHRIHHPEHCSPTYTLINHCKVDIIRRAMDIVPTASHFAWVDFGYCKNPTVVPQQFLNPYKLAGDRVNYTLINPIDPAMDRNVIYTLQHAPEKVGGFFFYGSKESLIAYRELYHLVHQWLQDNNIVDDDQHIALLCYLEKPDLFYMHNLGGFHRALTTFQKER